MNLYEINEALMRAWDNYIDPETGEVLADEAAVAIDSLQMQKEEKVEQIALWIKNLLADAEALKKEKMAFTERQARAEKKAESLKRYLTNALNGEKMSFDRASVSFRKSDAVILDNEDEFIKWAEENCNDLLKYKAPEINKADLKAALKDGAEIPFAHIESRQNIQIK